MHNSKLSDVPYHALQCCTQRELFEVLISLTHERLFGSGSSPNSAREQRSCSQIIVMLCLCTRRLYSNRLFFLKFGTETEETAASCLCRLLPLLLILWFYFNPIQSDSTFSCQSFFYPSPRDSSISSQPTSDSLMLQLLDNRLRQNLFFTTNCEGNVQACRSNPRDSSVKYIPVVRITWQLGFVVLQESWRYTRLSTKKVPQLPHSLR